MSRKTHFTCLALLALLLSIGIRLQAGPGDTNQISAQPPADAGSKPLAPKDLLAGLIGSWEGTCTTWLNSDEPADQSKIKGEIRPMLNGRLVRHTYDSFMLGKPRHGEETLAWNPITKRFQISWIDDFHMRNTILFSEGEPTNRGFLVKGKWETGPNAPAWGWNTSFELIDEDHLTIVAYVIKPDGQEKKATETKLTRVGK
jgi:hypothetical protein